ncbi:uncharacterized protein BO97DRAFT_267385 [Aspergillus homomorphus CBS 101889]|uniref:Uncharacterized protein n=1 Tax=Aspergillus homomorphus (strain CBS 101889) TaxID=1450537 RepID=A0A395HGS6_ASPHC|nr:hypothetical protein BO97DRAFT_267385 [Aspergillus homomorphus CBS 101889]RAL07111.1 hypothetical protein BO97DRAFT_267385 [Aspergillus homomorphus CBS 101889]
MASHRMIPTARPPSPESSQQGRSSPHPWASRRRDRDAGNVSQDEDEDEVLYDLDETALAQLPTHLQEAMRQLQLERVHNFQRASTGLRPGTGARPPRPTFHSYYAETWFQNMMARLTADQEMSEAHHVRNAQASSSQPEQDWRERKSQSLQATATYGKDSIWFANDGDLETSSQDVMVSEYEPELSSTRLKRFAPNFYEPRADERGKPLYETDSEGSKERLADNREAAPRQRKGSRSIISSMRCRVRRSVQRMGKLWKR